MSMIINKPRIVASQFIAVHSRSAINCANMHHPKNEWFQLSMIVGWVGRASARPNTFHVSMIVGWVGRASARPPPPPHPHPLAPTILRFPPAAHEVRVKSYIVGARGGCGCGCVGLALARPYLREMYYVHLHFLSSKQYSLFPFALLYFLCWPERAILWRRIHFCPAQQFGNGE